MTIPATETPLQLEQRMFRELSARLIDALLNRMFSLRPEKAVRRSSYVFILFLFSGFLISTFYYPLSEWVQPIGKVLTSLLSTVNTPAELNNSLTGLFIFFWKVITEPRILQYLPIFLSAFFIAQQSAAFYLADIFELEDVGVARRFINSVALSGSNETIYIKQGEIADESRESPVFLIGGPGKVVVEVDSVALFERADGTPHVIGPTGKEPYGKATLEGFERFRQALDIRDHFVNLRDQDIKSKAVKSRSRDGIPIKATDVRLMFSVYRGDNPKPSAEFPYPFDKEAVENIVYKATSRVTPDLSNRSTFEFSWINNMVGLIRGGLSGFMSRYELTEYLVGIDISKFDKTKSSVDQLGEDKKQSSQSGANAAKQEMKDASSFDMRQRIKDLFYQFANEFTSKAHSNGVELHWIGVGTWEPLVEIVIEKHLKAWLLSQDNSKNSSQDKIDKIIQMEVFNKMKEMIQKVPIEVYYNDIVGIWPPMFMNLSHGNDYENSDEYIKNVLQQKMGGSDDDKHGHKDSNHNKPDHPSGVKILLNEYLNQLIEIVDIIEDKNEVVPHNIKSAIILLSNLFGYEYKNAHWVGYPQTESTIEDLEEE